MHTNHIQYLLTRESRDESRIHRSMHSAVRQPSEGVRPVARLSPMIPRVVGRAVEQDGTGPTDGTNVENRPLS